MKWYSALIISFILVSVAKPTVALAQDATTTTSPTSTATTTNAGIVNRLQKTSDRISQAAAKQNTALTTIQAKADALIAQRITSLNNILSRIQNDQRLSSDEKSTLTANAQSDITGLNALKTKIDADTTVADARTDGKTIFTTYRVYEEFMPQMQLLIMLDNLQTMTDKITALLPKIQTLLTTLQGQGVDITTAQAALTDATTQLQTITTKITTDKTTVTGVTAQTTNANTVLQGVRQDINTVIKVDFQKIRTDIETIRTSLKTQKATGTITATPSATSTLTPTVSPTSGSGASE